VLNQGFLASYFGQQGFGTFLQVSALASHWLDDCAFFTPTPEERPIIGTPKKYKNQPRPLVRLSSVNFVQIFLNLSHETVPLKNKKKHLPAPLVELLIVLRSVPVDKPAPLVELLIVY